MRYRPWIIAVVVGVTGCAEGTAEDPAYASASSEEAAVQSGLLYFYVSPTAPGSQGFGTHALRRANAKPTTLSPTYGAATLPALELASDAVTTQAALDAVLAIPYAGHENSVVAIIGGRNQSSPFQDPLVEVVELYTPNQPVAINDAAGVTGVAQRDALFQLSSSSGKVTANLINEKEYPASAASSVSYDYSGSTNPAAAAVAVQGGALFTGKIDIVCKKVLIFWTKCDPPSGVHVNAFFAAN
jgi:hypothetical protein